MSSLVIDGLCAGYGTHQVLHGISARVDAGEIAVLVGANASGKTTLVWVLAGLHAHSYGHITWPGSANARRQAHRPGHYRRRAARRIERISRHRPGQGRNSIPMPRRPRWIMHARLACSRCSHIPLPVIPSAPGRNWPLPWR